MFVEFDLAGAEWVIVAYLAEDQNMIDIVESGRSPHTATGSLISGAPEDLVTKEYDLLGSATDPDGLLIVRTGELPELFTDKKFFIPRSMTIRQAGKKSNHGLNYDMRYKRFALENEMPETDAKPITERYHVAYPGIRDVFHADARKELRENDRTLVNLFGDKVRLLDQSGPELFDKAYAYKPQSTVGKIVTKAMVKAYHDHSDLMALSGLRANVHDSLLLNWPDAERDQLVPFALQMIEYMSHEFEVKGRRFTLKVDVKVGPNWGEMEKLRLPKTPKEPLEELLEHGGRGRDSAPVHSGLTSGQHVPQ